MNVERARAALFGLVLSSLSLIPTASVAATHEVGRSLFRDGLSPSGTPLQATRQGVQIEGKIAACSSCHRRSGLGMTEGRSTIPPIAGAYLFHKRAGTIDDLDLPYVEGMKPDREPYTDATLARAIRDGIGTDGKSLSVLMPRYQLDDASMAGLIAYLKDLAPADVPGVTPTVLHFATIITPDADPVAAKGMLDVLNEFFADKNHYTRAESPRLRSARRMMFKVNRHWELHVWRLSGAASSWDSQLQAKLAAEPVFAVIAGLGGATWAPVHRFCEAQEIPCLFPNTDVPVDAEADFESVYFSKGVLLEAQLIAQEARATLEKTSGARIVQVYRTGDVGQGAAAALQSALVSSSTPIVNEELASSASTASLRSAIGKTRPGDALVLWLRSEDIARLGAPPADVAAVYLSGRMGGLDQIPVPAQWRAAVHMAYPFELPQRRTVQLDYPLGWFRIRKIPVVAQQVQADTYLACVILSNTLNHMVDTFQRDYLVERIEQMLGHQILTGYYPRLTLGAGQRFASKGGYLVHLAATPGAPVIADGGWVVP